MKLAWSIETPVSDELPRQNEAIPTGATVPSIARVRDASATARTSVVDTQAWKAHLSLEEARFLAALVQVSEPGRPIVELGTLFGFTTIVLVLAKPRSQPLITVDGFAWNPSGLAPDEHYAATRSRLASAIAGENVSLRSRRRPCRSGR